MHTTSKDIQKSLIKKAGHSTQTSNSQYTKRLLYIEYAAPLLHLNEDTIKKLSGIQYRALKIMFKAPIGGSSTELHTKGNRESQIKTHQTEPQVRNKKNIQNWQ